MSANNSGLSGSRKNQIWMEYISSFHKVLAVWFSIISILNAAYFYIIVLLLSLFNIYIALDMRGMIKGRETYHFFIIGLHVFVPVFAISNIYYVIFKRETLKVIQCKLHMICRRLRIVGISSKMQRLLLSCAILQVVCYPAVVAGCALSYYLQAWFILHQLIWCIYIFDLFNNTAEYSLVISVVGQCYSKMRVTLGELAEGAKSKTVVEFVKLHDELIEICKGINRHFTVRVVLIVGFLLTAFIFQTFLTIDNHFTEMDTSKIGLLLRITAYFLLLLGIILLLILSCAANETEAETFNEALASLCIRDKTGTLVQNPYVTAHFAIGKKLKFSACGCFNIDYRLGYSMLAACITYLVILVEFDNKKDVVSEVPAVSTTPFPNATTRSFV